jgi:hypothetical protein
MIEMSAFAAYRGSNCARPMEAGGRHLFQFSYVDQMACEMFTHGMVLDDRDSKGWIRSALD